MIMKDNELGFLQEYFKHKDMLGCDDTLNVDNVLCEFLKDIRYRYYVGDLGQKLVIITSLSILQEQVRKVKNGEYHG